VQQVIDGDTTRGNMFVPTELLEPILDDLLSRGRRDAVPRPWLGVYLHDEDGRVVVQDVAPDGPAASAGLRPGDQIAALADQPVVQVAHTWRVLWRQGAAGVTVPMTIVRDGQARRVQVESVDRDAMLHKPRLQ
jgi:S1-C subfamily serine protease